MSSFDDDFIKKHQSELEKLVALVTPKCTVLDRAEQEAKRIEALLKPFGGAAAFLQAIEVDEARKQALINPPSYASIAQQELEKMTKFMPVIEHVPPTPVPRQDYLELQRRLDAAHARAQESEEIEELKDEIVSLKAMIRKLLSSKDEE